jgi:hypothetical protein
MSTGSIKKPKHQTFEDDLSRSLADVVLKVIQACDVIVDDNLWIDADKDLKSQISSVDEKNSQTIDTLKSDLDDINNRLGNSEGSISEQISSLRSEFEQFKANKPLELVVKTDEFEPNNLGKQHSQLPTLINLVASKVNIYLVGPAGSGKTHAAEQCAIALNVPFHFTGAVASEFKLTGFKNAMGEYVSTEFREAYENGGVFLFDEIDASYPQAVLAFNAALSNDFMDFPDKRVIRHKDFYCIAAANTYGQGADRQYVGRNQLDAASLDRFAFLDWKYDTNLERELTINDEWCDYVQKVRGVIEKNKIRHIVSPRASMSGAKLLALGIERDVVESTILWKGLDEMTKLKILDGLRATTKIYAPYPRYFKPRVNVRSEVKKGDVIGELFKYKEYSEGREELLSPSRGTVAFILNPETE